MERVFLHILSMSITASLLVVAVLALRLLLKKAPKALLCVLWGFVAIRLIFPISLESPFSLIPTSLTVSNTMLSDTGIAEYDYTVTENSSTLEATANPALLTQPLISEEVSGLILSEPATTDITEENVPDVSHTVLPGTDAKTPFSVRTLLSALTRIASVLWPLGVLGMLLYGGISYLRIHRKIKEAVLLYDNIWLCDHVETPFILGVFRPRILLPSSIQPVELQHVIAHEKAHLKRLDHFWKPLGFLLLSVYWFNPVLWIAYLFLCKDIELACDERVIRNMSTEDIKSYSSTLLSYSVSRKMISICPLAFGEVHVKKRIKNALHYKKPAFWIIAVAVLSCAVVAVCFLTNPTQKDDTSGQTAANTKGEIAFFSFDVTETGSDLPGVQIEPEPYAFYTAENQTDLSFQVQWNNNNYKRDFVYGDCFDILYYENGDWGSCATKEFYFPEVTHTLPERSNETKTYSLQNFDLTKSGRYRFQAEPCTGEYVWFEFENIVVYEDDPDSLTDSALLSIVHAITKNQTNVNRIIADYPELYNLLVSGGDATVACFVKELREAETYGLREYLMAHICSGLTGIGTEEGEYNPDTWWATADQWLQLYNKHTKVPIPGAVTQLSDKDTKQEAPTEFSLFWHPTTPVTRSLVWVNYYYNREKHPGGIPVLNLPEFPGVTFLANNQQIVAITESKMQTLISGEMLWTAYLADLNNDSFPEICATVSTGPDNSELSVVIYDYANKKAYTLRDSEQYNYVLYGSYDSMYLKKTDRSGQNVVFAGTLSLVKQETDHTFSLQLTEDPAAYESPRLYSDFMDLIGYSNLYADLALGENRWSSNEGGPVYTLFSASDWEVFTATYSDVKVWTTEGILSLAEAYTDDFAPFLESCPEDLYPTVILYTHGLSYGFANYVIKKNV